MAAPDSNLAECNLSVIEFEWLIRIVQLRIPRDELVVALRRQV